MIDESGDLGEGSGSGRTFIIAASVVEDLRQYRSIAKGVRRKYHGRKSINGELKHHNADEVVARYILNSIALSEVSIYWISYDKGTRGCDTVVEVYTQLLSKLLHLIDFHESEDDMTIIIDRFSKGSVLTSRFINKLKVDHQIHFGQHKDITLSCKDSLHEPALQVHDFVAGSVFRMVERSDREHYSIIEQKIVRGVRSIDYFWK